MGDHEHHFVWEPVERDGKRGRVGYYRGRCECGVALEVKASEARRVVRAARQSSGPRSGMPGPPDLDIKEFPRSPLDT